MRAAVAHLALLSVPIVARGDRPSFSVLLFLAIAVGFGAAEARAQTQERVGGEPLAILGGLSLLAVFWCGLATGEVPGAGTAALGAALMLAGVGLRIAAIRALGPWFGSTTAAWPGQPRVRRGVYRRLAHPSEIGLLAVGFGAALLLGSLSAAAVAALALLPGSIARVHREERSLCYHSPR